MEDERKCICGQKWTKHNPNKCNPITTLPVQENKKIDLPMTPDKVVKELEILNQLTNIEWYGKEREAIRTAITLIQDYQKLREKIHRGKFAQILHQVFTGNVY
ncbi:MAG: hypothetical protein WC479_10125 [Candidatus Izemoplasmatales bacterium]